MRDDFSGAVDQVIDEQNTDTAMQIRNNAQTNVGVSPDQEAEYQHLARFTETPIDTVRNQPDMVKQQAAAKQIDADDIVTKSPVTAKYLADANNSKLITDDIVGMRDLETTISQTSLLGGLGNNFALSAYSQYEGFKLLMADKQGDDKAAQEAIQNIQFANGVRNEYVPQIDSTVGQIAYDAVGGLVNSAPGVAAAFLNPFAAVALFGAQTKVDSYGRYRARGGSIDDAAMGSNLEGAVTVATSFLPMKYLTDKLGKVGMGEFLAGMLGREMATEQIENITNSVIDTAIANPEKSWKDWASELPQQVATSAVGSLMFAGVFGAVNGVMNRFNGNSHQAENALKNVETLTVLNEQAANNKLRQRDPEAFKRFVDEASENGPVQDLYFSPRDLAQSGIDPAELVKLMPSIEQSLSVAMETGQDVKISIGDFATSIAGSEMAQTVIDHLKIDPSGMSRMQADEYMKTEGEALQAEVQKIIEAKTGDNVFNTSHQAVEDNILQQLRGTQRFTDDVNLPKAKLLGNFYAVQAARLGISPEEMFQRHPLDVRAVDTDGTDGPQFDETGQPLNQEVQRAQRDALGFYSAVERETLNMNIPSWKKDGKAKGTEIWAKLKSLPVKKEELEWLGVEDYLNSATEKLSREEVAEFIRNKGVRVEEIVGDQEQEDGYESDLEWHQETVDDPDYVSSRAEDILTELRDEDYYADERQSVVMQIIEDEQDYIRQNVEGYEDVALHEMMTDAKVQDYVHDQFQDQIDSKLEDRAQEISQEQYDENPYMEWTGSNGERIFGNDDVGYQLTDPNGRSFGGDVYSFSEAEIQMRERLGEQGYLDGNEGPNVAKWGEYVADGDANNYRELKLTLPGIEDSFTKSSHFDDENIVAFLRVDDRNFKKQTDDQEKSHGTGKAYFIEEFQSDWHQAGREHGYKDGSQITNEQLDLLRKDAGDALRLVDNLGFDTTGQAFNALVDAQAKGDDWTSQWDVSDKPEVIEPIRAWLGGMLMRKPNAAPDAPFKGDGWISLGAKRAVIDAVEKGYDKIAWVDGETLENRWSSKYANLYETQYDKKMPSIFKKLTGQEPRHVRGEEGGTDLELTDVDGYWEVDITPELRKRIEQEGLPLFQERRGSFNPETNVMTLFKAADLSTFFHESGHFFLETMNKMSLDETAPQEIKDDMAATLKWLGVKDLADWNSRDIEQQREAHEKFARGFEAYLFEGKSPSVEMQGIFQRFRAWLLNVYQSAASLNVELNDEIRGVFDRMLATTDQVKEAEAARAYEPFFKTQSESGMTDDEWRAYQDLGIQATLDAVTNLESRSMRDMRFASNAKSRTIKRLQAQAKSKRNSVRREVTDAVMNEPVNRARTFLKDAVIEGEAVEGVHRLDIATLREMYGDGPDAVWRQLESKFGKYGILGADGLHPDVVADMFGFSSGDEMVRALAVNENPRTRIQADTDRVMLERYGDLTSPQAMERAADEAIHNDVRLRFVATELNALNKAIGNKVVMAKAAKDFAASMVARLKIRDLKPSRYTVAESKSARNAETARKNNDLVSAAIEKRNQLINGYAAKAVYDAQENIEKGVRYLKKFENNKIRKVVDPENVDQINALLERFDLKERSLKTIDQRKSLASWVEAQKEVGIEPEIDPAILDEANRKNYKDMTVEEMNGLLDAVKQLDHLGRMKNKLLTAERKETFDAIVSEMVTSIDDHAGNRRADNRTRSGVGDVMRLFKGFVAAHRKVANIARELDGWKDAGPVWDTLIRTMNARGDQEADMRAKATRDVATLVKPIMEGGKMGGKGKFFPTLGMSLNREERIAMALNHGNEGNLQRLLGGEGWTMDQVQPVFNTLTKADWEFVQSIWDFFESYRPQIAAKERRVYGVEPTWVEPTPFIANTPEGPIEMRGGYYPIKYDPRRSQQAEQHNDAEAAKQQMRGAYTSATTRRSFTKSRVDEVTGRPLMYSFDGLYSGLNEVIHDLSWHEWLIDANRLMRSKSLDNAIRSTYGAETVRQMKTAFSDIATGDAKIADDLEKVLGPLRTGATFAGLGFNIMNSMINTVGITQSMVRIGPRWVARGISRWVSNPVSAVNDMYEQSNFMRLRGQTMNRELNEIRNIVQGKSNVRQKIDAMMFAPMTMTQVAVDTPTWWGAKEKALSEGHTEKKAVALADQAVIDAQGGGQVKDLAAIQRGGSIKKLLTTFYSFFSTTYNLSVESAKKTNFKDPTDVLRLGGDFLLLYAVPALLSTLLKNAVTSGLDQFEDPEKLGKQLVNDQISFLMSVMVGVREAIGFAQKAAGVSSYNMAYGGPAGLRFFNELDKLGTQIGQGKLDRALTRSAINVAGITLHLPSSQINRTLDGIISLSEGKTSNPLVLVSGPPPKK